ncbi:hypothetical protein CF149_23686 [Pseudomonas psychrophila]|nr:hypothetical protein CF149_23686 [Pseudomonas psychrophila]
MTFRVTSLLGIQLRWASLQRAPVAGVPYLLALSKSSLNGVLGVECSNHSVPTILFNDLAQLSRVGLFHMRDFFTVDACLLFKIVSTGPRESAAEKMPQFSAGVVTGDAAVLVSEQSFAILLSHACCS